MTTKELKERVDIRRSIGYDIYKITITYRGRNYECSTNNSLAYDRITGYADDVPVKATHNFYTYKGALEALYDECKRKNALGIYALV